VRNGEAEKAELALHVAAMLIEKMRAALPGSGRHAGRPVSQTLTVAREHDALCTALIIALTPFVGKLDTEITLKTPGLKGGSVTVECTWGKAVDHRPQTAGGNLQPAAYSLQPD
jgi:hypothetical protein